MPDIILYYTSLYGLKGAKASKPLHDINGSRHNETDYKIMHVEKDGSPVTLLQHMEYKIVLMTFSCVQGTSLHAYIQAVQSRLSRAVRC